MTKKAIDRPFAPEILQAAEEIVGDYHITLKANKRMGFIGNCCEIPTIFGVAESEEECEKRTREAIKVCLAFMFEEEMTIPKPDIKE